MLKQISGKTIIQLPSTTSPNTSVNISIQIYIERLLTQIFCVCVCSFRYFIYINSLFKRLNFFKNNKILLSQFTLYFGLRLWCLAYCLQYFFLFVCFVFFILFLNDMLVNTTKMILQRSKHLFSLFFRILYRQVVVTS